MLNFDYEIHQIRHREKHHQTGLCQRNNFNMDDLPDGGHLLQTVTIPPQTKQKPHYHDSQTEIFYILEGECIIYINNEEFMAIPGDAFVCSPGESHYLWNKTDKILILVVFKIGLTDKDDTHWQEIADS